MPDPSLDSESTASARGSWTDYWTKLPTNVRGGLLFILAAALFSVMVTLIKVAGETMHVTQVLFFRQVTMTVVALPVILAGWPASLHSERPKLQLFRVLVAFMAMTLGFGAFIELPLAEVTVISFSKSFFMTLLAIVVLQEVVNIPRWTALLLGFAGVMVIVWPTDGAGWNIWHLAALASALCVAVVMVVIRILSQVDKPVTILTYQAVGVGALMFLPMLYFWQMPTAYEWGLIIAIGVVSAAAQYVNIIAIRAAEASALAPLEYVRLVFAVALGWWIFSEWPDPRVWIGAIVIIGAALFVLHREQRAARQSQDEPTSDGQRP
ncbi:MAG: DMT family transporter [Pseudomonadota bacterium]